MAQTYTPEQVTEGLMSMVTEGSAAAAHRKTGIPEKTLQQWRRETYAERFRQLEERYSKELEEHLVHEARKNAELALQAERDMIERVSRVTSEREVSGALRALADSRTKSVQSVLTMTGRPTAITESRDIGSVLKALAAKGVVRFDAEGSAEEERSDAPQIGNTGS